MNELAIDIQHRGLTTEERGRALELFIAILEEMEEVGGTTKEHFFGTFESLLEAAKTPIPKNVEQYPGWKKWRTVVCGEQSLLDPFSIISSDIEGLSIPELRLTIEAGACRLISSKWFVESVSDGEYSVPLFRIPQHELYPGDPEFEPLYQRGKARGYRHFPLETMLYLAAMELEGPATLVAVSRDPLEAIPHDEARDPHTLGLEIFEDGSKRLFTQLLERPTKMPPETTWLFEEV